MKKDTFCVLYPLIMTESQRLKTHNSLNKKSYKCTITNHGGS